MSRHYRFAGLATVEHEHDGVPCDSPVWDEGQDMRGNHGGPCVRTGDWVDWCTT